MFEKAAVTDRKIGVLAIGLTIGQSAPTTNSVSVVRSVSEAVIFESHPAVFCRLQGVRAPEGELAVIHCASVRFHPPPSAL